jgi:CRISPR-associated endonuclease/helicase Cas3
VLVFTTDNPQWAPPPELKQFAQVFRGVQRRHQGEDLLNLETVRAYFRELYWQKGPLELDAHDLMGLLKRSRQDSLPFETLAQKFKVIETVMRPVIVPYDREARDALRALEFAESCGGIARRLQPYMVQLPHLAYCALDTVGAIQPVAEQRYGRQFMQLVNLELYSEKFGLCWDNPSFLRAESLVI